MKQEDNAKSKAVFDYFEKLFPSYATEYRLIDDDITLSYAFVIDSGNHRAVLKVYRAFWEDHNISQINNLLLNFKPLCVQSLQNKQNKVLSIPEFQAQH